MSKEFNMQSGNADLDSDGIHLNQASYDTTSVQILKTPKGIIFNDHSTRGLP